MDCWNIETAFSHVKPEETINETTIELRGRISSKRLLSKKLLFIDILDDDVGIQAVCDTRKIHNHGVNLQEFLEALRPGDIVSVTGHPHRTARGELSIKVGEPPKLLAPCLHPYAWSEARPSGSDSDDTSSLNGEVVNLWSASHRNTLKTRFEIIKGIKKFFDNRDYLEVSTPILAKSAGGAVARAFETKATEFENRQLSLRIAPELWLKRLVIGGFHRIYEIGPSFRNEGLDKTHNPEFYSCEFYQTFTTLTKLMDLTMELITSLVDVVRSSVESHLHSGQDSTDFSASFKTIEFIPGLESAMNMLMPPLHDPSAVSKILEIFNQKRLALPDNTSLPHLLDKLSSIYLEPQSLKSPIFVTHHPECLSPLSKSFEDPQSKQMLSARAELFMAGMEIANMYEEENSPFEQRRKFEMQARFAGVPEGNIKVDEDYLRAMEWGLPPTGGWGCGLDRLTMFLTGKDKIGDVLPFGNLRAVTRGAEISKEEP
ncbi:MAG: hypothetical protein Q9227_000468 [Pyrenula ochraceoflavens]